MNEQQTFLIIDGNSMACRAAFARRDIFTSYGRETGGTHIFVGMIDSLLTKVKPTHMVVAWDVSKTTFRNEIDENYKANRESKSDNLYMQFEDIKRILDALNIKYVGIYGYEADDVIGTYSKISPPEVKNIILSGDKDGFQLIDNRTVVHYPKMGVTNIEVIDESVVLEKFGVRVDQYIDQKALTGDGGDNVIGIEGCGIKKAAALLQTYGTLEEVVANADKVKGKLGEKLREWMPAAEKTKKLVTIKRDVPVPFSFAECKLQNVVWENAREIFEELEFNGHVKKLDEGRFHDVKKL